MLLLNHSLHPSELWTKCQAQRQVQFCIFAYNLILIFAHHCDWYEIVMTVLVQLFTNNWHEVHSTWIDDYFLSLCLNYWYKHKDVKKGWLSVKFQPLLQGWRMHSKEWLKADFPNFHVLHEKVYHSISLEFKF